MAPFRRFFFREGLHVHNNFLLVPSFVRQTSEFRASQARAGSRTGTSPPPKENGQPKGGMGGRHAATTQGF